MGPGRAAPAPGSALTGKDSLFLLLFTQTFWHNSWTIAPWIESESSASLQPDPQWFHAFLLLFFYSYSRAHRPNQLGAAGALDSLPTFFYLFIFQGRGYWLSPSLTKSNLCPCGHTVWYITITRATFTWPSDVMSSHFRIGWLKVYCHHPWTCKKNFKLSDLIF